MTILYRYILREVALFSAITLLIFTTLLLTVRMIRFAALVINKGVDGGQVLEVMVSIVPTFLEIALPLAILLGVMLAFARFSGDSEIVVLRSSGISLWQITGPVVLFGILSGAFGFYVSLHLKPWGHRNLAEALFDIARSKSTSGLTSGVFNPLGQLTLYAQNVDYDTGALQNVLVDDRRDRALRQVVIAQRGFIRSNPQERTISILLKDGTIHEQQAERYTLTKFEDNIIAVNSDELVGANDESKEQPLRAMKVNQLRGTVDELKHMLAAVPVPAPDAAEQRRIERRLVRARIELSMRYAMPITVFIFALIGLPLGIQPPRTQRTWGAGLSVLLALLVFVFYFAVLSVGFSLAESGSISAELAVWLPNLLSAICAFVLLRNLASERWVSVAEMLADILAALRRRVVRSPA